MHLELPGASTRVRIPDRDEVDQLPDDAYPAIFRDQRHMVPGGLECENAEAMWVCWAEHLAKVQHIEPTPDQREVVPFLNHGRWIANCPACGCGMACWDRNPYACCLGKGCGRTFKVLWQTPQLRSEVMRVLAGRIGCKCHYDDPLAHLNWDAHQGETVEELKVQNVRLLGVTHEKRNELLVAENVPMPDDLTSVDEYLERLRRSRKAV